MITLVIVLSLLVVAALVWVAFGLRQHSLARYQLDLFNPWLLVSVAGAQAVACLVLAGCKFGFLAPPNVAVALFLFVAASASVFAYIVKKSSLAVGSGAIALLELAGLVTIVGCVLVLVGVLLFLFFRGPVYRVRI